MNCARKKIHRNNLIADKRETHTRTGREQWDFYDANDRRTRFCCCDIRPRQTILEHRTPSPSMNHNFRQTCSEFFLLSHHVYCDVANSWRISILKFLCVFFFAWNGARKIIRRDSHNLLRPIPQLRAWQLTHTTHRKRSLIFNHFTFLANVRPVNATIKNTNYEKNIERAIELALHVKWTIFKRYLAVAMDFFWYTRPVYVSIG